MLAVPRGRCHLNVELGAPESLIDVDVNVATNTDTDNFECNDNGGFNGA